jgi:hypothetical protein
MASPRPALVISRRADGTTPVDTRGWMGGVSRRAILSIKPETFFRAVFETWLKIPRSLSRKCVKGYTPVEALSRRTQPVLGRLHGLDPISAGTGSSPTVRLLQRALDSSVLRCVIQSIAELSPFGAAGRVGVRGRTEEDHGF